MSTLNPAAVLTPLTRVAVGNCAEVVSIRGEGPVRRRLLELGLCRGVEVEVVRRAPLGDPLELKVRGYLLSLRGAQADLVQVQERR